MYYCTACSVYVKEASAIEHDASSAHLVSASKAPALRKVWLPETNRGYRLLMNMGWKSGTGLGPTGAGRVEPVATVHKTDRAGIGARPTTALAPTPTRKRKAEAPPSSSQQMTQAERKARRLQDAQRDRAIGRELYGSALDGYEALMQ